MNILLIPSWYPDERNYVQGIFIKEQFEAIAEFNKDSNFLISHIKNFNLPLKKPAESLKSLYNYSKEDKIVYKELNTNLFITENSALGWTDKLNGNINAQIRFRVENFLFFRKNFGKIDLIHAHVSYPAGYIAMILKEKFGVPYIITEHMGPFPFPQFIKKGKLTNRISNPILNSGKIIAVSSSLAKKIEFYTNNKPVVIPNLVNENVFIPAQPIQLKKNKITFLTVSNLIESKGINELLIAAKNSCGINKKIEFIIIGNGKMENNIRRFINDHNLDGNIFLISDLKRKEIIEQFRNCDVYILPSRHESFGVSYIEALACGKPVIATDCGGPSDFVNAENGILVPVENVEAITNSILYMADNYKKYNPESIRKFFLNNFSREVVCSKIYRLYKEVSKENE